MSTAVDAGAAQAGTGRSAGTQPQGSWVKRHPVMWLAGQIIVLLVCIIAVFVWLANADLTETEAATLAPDALWVLTLQHLELTIAAALIVLVIGIPLGVLLTRGPFRRATGPILAVANVGQAAPAVGLVVLLAMWLGFGFWPVVVALVAYSLLPVLRNTMVGLDGVNRSIIEAGRGMGMSAGAVLIKVELPLAVPVMLAGIRTALVLLVGTASLGTFVGGGGLGSLIVTGVNLSQTPVLIVGSLLVALLALVIDWVGRVVEFVARPKGL